jgi:hypothetical protein
VRVSESGIAQRSDHLKRWLPGVHREERLQAGMSSLNKDACILSMIKVELLSRMGPYK